MIKRAVAALLGGLLMLFVLLLIALVWLVGTTSGARFAANAATELVPDLALEVTGGTLWRGLAVHELRWRMDGVEVSGEDVAFRWRPECGFGLTLCLDRLELSGLRVEVDTEALAGDAPPDDPAADEPAGRIDLPVTVELGLLSLNDARISVDDNHIELDSLTTGFSAWSDQLRVRPTAVRGLRVELPEPAAEEDQAAQAEEVPAAVGPITLPEIEPPLDAHIERLELIDTQIRRGDLQQRLDRLLLVARVEGDRLHLERLAASHSKGDAELSGEISFSDDWPLRFALDLDATDLPQIGAQRLHAELTGSAADLSLDATAEGAVSAMLSANAAPLNENLPWSATLDAAELRWPLGKSEALARVRDLELIASGGADRFRAELDAAVSGADIPEGDWSLMAEGDAEAVRVERLTGETLDGRIEVAGRFGWIDGLRWDATANAEGLVLDRYLPEVSPRVSGEIATRGSMVGEDLAFELDIPGIEGELGGYALALRGSVSRSADDRWAIPGLQLSNGPNQIRIEGRLGEAWDADARVDLPELDALWPGLSGQIAGSVTLAGPRFTPTVEADLAGQAVAFEGNRIEQLRLQASVAEAFNAASSVRLRTTGINTPEQAIGDLALTLEGTRADHDLALTLDGPLAGADIGLGGGLDSETLDWDGSLERARLDLPDGVWELAAAAALRWRQAEQRVRVGEHCWTRAAARLCADQPLEAGPAFARASVTLADYDLQALQPWLPEDLAVLASVDADADIAWDGDDRPRVDVAVTSRDGTLRLTEPETEEVLDFTFNELALTAELGRDEASVAVDLSSDALGQGAARIRVDPYSERREITGDLSLTGVQVGAARPFVPALEDLSGGIDVQGDLGGTLESPEFHGEVRLADGRVAPRAVPTAIEDIDLVVDVSGRAATLRGGFRVGEGTARIGGSVDWTEGLNATVGLNGERLEIRYPPYASLEVSPAVTLAVRPGEVSVSGRIAVPSGEITVDSLPQRAVGVSSDVTVIEEGETAAAAEKEEAGGLTLNSNLYLVLGDDVQFEGFGAEGRLAGALQLRQVGTAGAEAAGEIRLEDGRFAAYGQRLQIRRGRLLFAGPLGEPRLDIEAIREVEDVVAGLRITGPAEQPEVELFSEPSMPQGDILTYLVTGRAPGGESPSESQLISQAALSLGVLGGRGIGSSLAEQFGVEDFRLEAGDEGDVAMSGYVAPNLLVRYGVGVFQPENTLTLRYYLTRNLYLEAVSGFDSALDLFYTFDF